jgi:hypothetical protein
VTPRSLISFTASSLNSRLNFRRCIRIQLLYLPRLDGRDPTATKPALELDLVRIRIAALPPAVINALAGFPRFGRYLGLRSSEIVTIRGARFEAGRFWRAVRAARRYGKGKIRTVDGRRSGLRGQTTALRSAAGSLRVWPIACAASSTPTARRLRASSICSTGWS